MIRSRGRAATATAAMFLLVLGACSPQASSPGQNTTDTAVPSRTQAPSTAPNVTSSPSAAPLTARRAPTPLRAVRPSDLIVRIDSLGELCCPAPVVVATVDGRLVTRAADGTLVERRLTAAGVQRLRDEVVGTGLFVSDREVRLELTPGASPVPHGISARTFRAWRGARCERCAIGSRRLGASGREGERFSGRRVHHGARLGSGRQRHRPLYRGTYAGSILLRGRVLARCRYSQLTCAKNVQPKDSQSARRVDPCTRADDSRDLAPAGVGRRRPGLAAERRPLVVPPHSGTSRSLSDRVRTRSRPPDRRRGQTYIRVLRQRRLGLQRP